MAGARQVALGHRHSRRPVAAHAHVRVQAAAVLQRASAQPHGRGPFPAGRPSSSDGQSDHPAVAAHLRLSAVAPAASGKTGSSSVAPESGPTKIGGYEISSADVNNDMIDDDEWDD